MKLFIKNFEEQRVQIKLISDKVKIQLVQNIEFICERCGKKSILQYRALLKKQKCICKKCQLSDTFKNTNEKRLNTLQEKYGVKHNFLIKEVKENIKSTMVSKYGAENPWSKKSSLREKGDKTKLEKYGSINNIKKRNETCLKKYGTSNHIEKIQDTCLKKYGNKWQIASEQTRQKIKNTMLERYGRYVVRKFYIKDGNFFDSSWELAYYIWLCDSGLNFKCHPKSIFKYLGDDGKYHEYFPDFEVEGTFIDLKGGQFFNELNEPVVKYNGKSWKKKFDAMKDHGVKILLWDDIKPKIQYVNKTYGKEYLKSFKYKNS